MIQTKRLLLRKIVLSDAPFMLELLNDPGFITNIRDAGVRTLDEARSYIQNGPLKNSDQGLGLFLIEHQGSPVGITSLLKRDTLPHVDVGYALLQRYEGKGYALEATQATLTYGRETLKLSTIVAFVNPGNEKSVRLLIKLGFKCDGPVSVFPGKESLLFT